MPRTPLFASLVLFAATGLAHGQFVANVDYGLGDTFVAQQWFDVEAVDLPITICSLEFPVLFDPSGPLPEYKVELYTRAGSHQGFESSSVGWELRKVVLYTPVSAATPCPIDIPGGFTVQPGVGGAITLIVRDFPEQPVGLPVRSGVPSQTVVFASPEIQVRSGVSNSSGIAFNGAEQESSFAGILHFTVGAAACILGTPLVNLPATLFDGPEPGGVGPLQAGRRYVVQSGPGGFSEVPLGKTLTAGPGTQIFFGSTPATAGRLNVKGTIDFQGVTLGSVHEGDLDGQLGLPDTLPQPGDWEGVRFDFASDSSSWDGGALRYAGNLSFLSPLTTFQSDATIQKVSVVDNAGGGGAALDLSDNSRPSVEQNYFARNDGIAVTGVPLQSLPGFVNNVAADNAKGDYLMVAGGSTLCDPIGPGAISTDVVIQSFNYPGDAFVIDGPVCVKQGGSLTFEQGVHVKFPPGQRGGITADAGSTLDVNGTAAFPVTFSSTDDDAFGGDTTRNGPTSGLVGDIRGLRYKALSQGELEHATILNGGGAVFPIASLSLESDGVSASDLRISGSSNEGLRLQHPWMGVLENVFIEDTDGTGILVDDDSLVGILHTTVVNCGGFGLDVDLGPAGGGLWGSVASSNFSNNQLGNYSSAVDASQVSFSNGGFAGVNGNIDADPQLGPDGAPLATSPLIDAGAPITSSGAAPFDLADGGRTALTLNALFPDMGALEFSDTELTLAPLQFGQQLAVDSSLATSANSLSIYAVGVPGSLFVPGFGQLGVELGSALLFGPVPTGPQDLLEIDGPPGSNLVGQDIGVQGLIFDLDSGGFFPTNVELGTILPPPVV